MPNPAESGKKYIQLTDNILLEYVFVSDSYSNGNTIDNLLLDSQTNNIYGKSSNNDNDNKNQYIIANSKYTNELYFMNNINTQAYTNNSIYNSILPINKNNTQWVRMLPVDGNYYSNIDNNWCTNSNGDTLFNGEPSLLIKPSVTTTNNIINEYIPYDILRIYFQSGYHSEYDGFIFNLYTKSNTNTYINLLSAIHENTDDVKMVSEPMWFADKIYTTYIEYRIPSTAYMSSDCLSGDSNSMTLNNWVNYNRLEPTVGSLPYYLTKGVGFYSNPSIGIDIHAIIGYTPKQNFKIYKTSNIVSTIFPNKDTYDKLIASVRNADDGDYYNMYGFYEDDASNPQYSKSSLYNYLSKFNGTFTLTHIITVSETYTNNGVTTSKVHAPMTNIQTWDAIKSIHDEGGNPFIQFRPVLEHTDTMDQATITYTLRIISNRDNTSIIKSSSCNILNPGRFAKNISVATLNDSNVITVYNRIEQLPTLTVSAVTTPIGAPKSINSSSTSNVVQVNRYVTSSFIDRRNIRISVSPVKINNTETT